MILEPVYPASVNMDNNPGFEVKASFEQYLKGAKTMPIPTYVCDATRHGSEYPLGKNLAGNLTVSFRLAEHL